MAVPVRGDDEAFVRRATQRFTDRLVHLLTHYRDSGRDPLEVLGEPEDLADRALTAQAPELSPWDELIGPFVRSDGVQARLGITRQAVAAKAARRRLLRVITSDGQMLYPAWQFDDGHVVPGLADVLALFAEDAVDGWTLAGWLRREDAELGAIPFEELKHGDPRRVLTAARSAAAAFRA